MGGTARRLEQREQRFPLTRTMLAAVFVGALFAYVVYAGTSPIASLDTFYEEREVQQCVAADSCTLEGMGTSLPGLVHGVGWLEVRTLLAWIGTGVDGAHVTMQILNALAVVLVFYLAAQLGGGPLAGVLAVCILQFGIGSLVTRTELYNSSPLLFLGAVFVLACTAAVQRPGMLSIALTALVGAVMANDHLACITTGASLVWVALCAPRRALALALYGTAVFALATLAVAPPVWLHDVAALLQRSESIRHTSGGEATLPYNPLLFWAPVAIGLSTLALLARSPAWTLYRRRMHGPLAVLVPFFAAYLVASRFGIVAYGKYLAHVKAACAIAAAAPLALLAGPLLSRAMSPAGLRRLDRALPYAAALLIAVEPYTGRLDADARSPTFGDLRVVFPILHDQREWDFAAMLRRVKAPYGISVQTGLQALSGAADPPGIAARDDGTNALLLVLDTAEVPRTLPPSWTLVRQSARSTAVLITTRSRIDWSHFEMRMQSADGDPQPWSESSLRLDDPGGSIAIPHFPPAGFSSRGALVVRLPLRPADPGAREDIFMPRMFDVCGGRIASPSDAGLEVASDGRRASLIATAPDVAGPSAIEIEWQIGSPECGGWAYDGLPPFFVAGDPLDVQPLETILRSRETR
jgi:hypothetical protein